MICEECGFEFDETKVDAEVAPNWTYCGEICAEHNCVMSFVDESRRTAATLQQHEGALQLVRPGRSWLSDEQQTLNDTLAILSDESGAQRQAGPPASLELIAKALQALKARGAYGGEVPPGYSLFTGTLDQLEGTVSPLSPRATSGSLG